MSRLHLLIFLLLCVDRSCGLNNKHVVYMLRVMNGDKQWICEKRYSVSATVCCASVSITVVQHAGQPVHSWNSRACNTKEHAGAHTHEHVHGAHTSPIRTASGTSKTRQGCQRASLNGEKDV